MVLFYIVWLTFICEICVSLTKFYGFDMQCLNSSLINEFDTYQNQPHFNVQIMSLLENGMIIKVIFIFFIIRIGCLIIVYSFTYLSVHVQHKLSIFLTEFIQSIKYSSFIIQSSFLHHCLSAYSRRSNHADKARPSLLPSLRMDAYKSPYANSNYRSHRTVQAY